MTMPAPILWRTASDQPQVRFVDQRGCLEILPRLLAGKFLCGELA